MLAKFTKFTVFILALTVLSTAGSFVIQTAFAAWNGPTANPPSGNVENLLNTSATAQTKSGDLTANKLTASAGGLCLGADCKTAWSQVSGTASGWTDGGTSVYLSTLADKVGIGTDAPNKQLHIKTVTGNAEMDIQSASQNYWALYQDATSGELRYWNNSVTSTSTKNALVITSTGYLKLPTPIDANDAATKGYVDAAGGGDATLANQESMMGTGFVKDTDSLKNIRANLAALATSISNEHSQILSELQKLVGYSSTLTYPGATHTGNNCLAQTGGSIYTSSSGTLCKITGTNVSCPSGWTQADYWQAYSTIGWGNNINGDTCYHYADTGPISFANTVANNYEPGFGDSTYYHQGCSQIPSCSSTWCYYDGNNMHVYNSVSLSLNPTTNRTAIGCK